MKKIIPCVIIIFCLSFNVNAQQNAGSWQLKAYTSNIIKVTFNFNEYSNAFNVNNAVVLKPSANLKAKYTLEKDSSISLNSYEKTINIKLYFDKEGNKGFSFKLAKDEQVYGGGERALPLNRRGYAFNLYNNPWYHYELGADNLNYSVPFFITNKGYGIFFDNASKGYVDIGKSDSNLFKASFSYGEINAYIIIGETYQEILTEYHKLTGTQPLPPRWALGNLMSRFGYTSEKQVTEIAASMKKERMPIDAIIYDLFWFGDEIKGTLGNLDWINKEKWPNPKAMIEKFKKQNINTTLITEPYILEYTNSFNESLDFWTKDGFGNPYVLKNFYFGKGGLIDIFRKDAGNWIWNYHYKKQINNGVVAWWTDLGEPESHPEEILHNLKDLGIAKSQPAKAVHNIYGHYWNKMLFENYSKDYPNQRLFHLNRSGFAGSQRFSIFPWSGDVARNWSGLKAQPLVMLGMSLSGVPYIHADAGGFALGEKDEELFVRWLQFATYTPIFRPHGTALYDIDPAAPSFPSEAALYDEPYKSLAKKAIIERYELLPYIYTLAYRQTQFAEPIVKPLFYNYANDSNAVNQNNQYLFGDNILVAPVLDKMANEMQVYLPENNWYNAERNEMFKGNSFITLDVQDYKKGIFHKEGSFTPTYNCNGENTSEINRENVNILYIPSTQKTSFEMYDDDGENAKAIQQKQFETISFNSSGVKNNGLSFTIKSNNGIYKSKPKQRNIKFNIPQLNKPIKQILVNNAPIKSFSNNNNILEFLVAFKNTSTKIDIIY